MQKMLSDVYTKYRYRGTYHNSLWLSYRNMHQNEESRRMERLKPHQMKHNENTVGIVIFEIRYIRSLM